MISEVAWLARFFQERAAMATLSRDIAAIVLTLAAGRADGRAVAQGVLSGSIVGAAPLVAMASLGLGGEELRLDRELGNLASPGPFLAYALPASLEESACSDPDNHRLIQGRIESVVIRAAAEQLNLPMGSGRFLAVNGKKYLFCLEPHYREPGTGSGPVGWHKGVTVYDAS
jgi:hypothetical protein